MLLVQSVFVVSTSFVEVLPDGVVLLFQSLRGFLERLKLSWGGVLSGFSFGVSYFCSDKWSDGGVVVAITLDCSEEVGVKAVDVIE